MEHVPNAIPDPEPIKFPVPESLQPKEDGPRFPEITRKDLVELAKAGWDRVGIVALVIDPSGKLLTVTHSADYLKVPAGVKGITSETLTYDANNVEQPVPGISRLFSEELGLKNEVIEKLHLTTVDHGAWQNMTFPMSMGRSALGFVIVLRADQDSADSMTQGFKPTREVSAVEFIRPDPLAHGGKILDGFRDGTLGSILVGLDHVTTPVAQSKLELAPAQKRYVYEDIKDILTS